MKSRAKLINLPKDEQETNFKVHIYSVVGKP